MGFGAGGGLCGHWFTQPVMQHTLEVHGFVCAEGTQPPQALPSQVTWTTEVEPIMSQVEKLLETKDEIKGFKLLEEAVAVSDSRTPSTARTASTMCAWLRSQHRVVPVQCAYLRSD